MSIASNILYTTKEYTVVLNALNAPSVTLKIIGNEYYEYIDQIETKKQLCTDIDLAFILIELRIQKLQGEGYICETPQYTPNTTIHIENNFPFNVKRLFNQEQIDFEQVDYTTIRDKLFIKFEDADLVTLFDCLKPRCEESKIPELQINYKALNCIHIALLRKLFYLPIAQKLSGIWLSCGLDGLPQVVSILKNAKALFIPISLTINPEYDYLHSKAPKEQLITAIKKLNIIELKCEAKYMDVFQFITHKLKSLCLWQTFINSESSIKKALYILQQYQFNQLSYLTINTTKVEDNYLEELLVLPIINKLSYLDLFGHYIKFPFNILREHTSKWQHLDSLIINGSTASKSITDVFKEYPQIIFQY